MNEWKIQYIYAMKLQKNNPKACYNMREPQKHFAKWKKLNKNVYILYDSTYVKCSEKTSLSRYRNIEILKNNWFFFWLEFWRRKWLHMELWEFIRLWKCSKNELPEKIFLCDLVILICKGSHLLTQGMFHVYLKRLCILLFFSRISINVTSSSLIVVFSPSICLIIFCPLVLLLRNKYRGYQLYMYSTLFLLSYQILLCPF